VARTAAQRRRRVGARERLDHFRAVNLVEGVGAVQVELHALGLEVEVVLGKVQHFTLVISDTSPPTIPPANSSASRSKTITSELRTAVGDPLAHARGYSVHRSPFHSLTLVAKVFTIHRLLITVHRPPDAA
jgi:hypothetical protein